jgi:hypothetical protein
MNLHICMYKSVYVYICTYLYCICLFYQDSESIFACICLYIVRINICDVLYVRICPSIDACWYGQVNLIFKIRVRTDAGPVIECQCALIETLFDYCPSKGRNWYPHLESYTGSGKIVCTGTYRYVPVHTDTYQYRIS